MVNPEINIIFAKAFDNGIGLNGTMPWPHLREDMQHFRKRTMGKAVIMGRLTFDSLNKKPLPDRHNIVVSSTLEKSCERENLEIAVDLTDAVQKAQVRGFSEIWVIGGKLLIEEAVSVAKCVSVTAIHRDTYNGNTDVKIDSKVFSFLDADFDAAIILQTKALSIMEYRRRECGNMR